MKTISAFTIAGLTAIALITTPMTAHADDTPSPKGGAVKGAVVGGVAGHMMGGHTKTGAAVGALAGHHEKVKSQARINAGGQP